MVAMPTYGVQRQSGRAMAIALTAEETELCELLDGFTTHYRQTNPTAEPLTLRIAGGWVRDKLLGMESHDIDVAIDRMTGYDMAVRLTQFLRQHGHKQHHVTKIKSNPDKSKHLETATTHLLGLDIDFVNLRSEVYNADSRIPAHQAFGTPEEDANRRDITINALFYNIHTRKVEDFTGQGLTDLAQGVIRTPLAAYETFMDDPLRILRCVRFASRFAFAIEQDIAEAMDKVPIRQALQTKISRERVGVEVDKMLRHRHAPHAVERLVHHNLFPLIFTLPTHYQGMTHNHAVAHGIAQTLQWLAHPEWLALLTSSAEAGVVARELPTLYLSACLFPYRDVTFTEGKRVFTGPQYVVREGLKLSNNDMDKCHKVISTYPVIRQLVDRCIPMAPSGDAQWAMQRDLGRFIRSVGDLWLPVTVFALGVDLVPLALPSALPPSSLQANTQLHQRFAAYQRLIQFAQDHGLSRCYTWKTLLSGKEVAALLGIRPGPVMGEILDVVMAWQFNHPMASVADCRAFVTSDDPQVQALRQSAQSEPEKPKRRKKSG
ncbi:CCA tRNA nucleotidyltransferase, mitochondrial [Dimargaris verticillata]|uniref:CCA tRNA nucleotidyltransferase, mitochondrial n=1 Tax=Dimargaris verticillata TaxID=2761393 RepID=A0A9W8EEB0_9FUNG|nr:CCA tRNA nucleotidyltransferase, mitochondrial [Dimargaris verticillata]